MTRFLLDSSLILEILHGTPRGSRAARVLNGGELTTSVVCRCEVLNTVKLEYAAAARNFLSGLLTFPVTIADGESAESFQEKCNRAGKHVSTLDCVIAAAAANNDAILATVDSDFSRIAGLELKLF